MDKCLRTIVAVTVLSQLTAAGSYPGVRLDKHSQFHHSFEHHDPGEWTDGAHSWEPSDHYSNEPDQYPSKRSKEYWRLHHNDGYEPHFHGEPHRPREWHHHEPDSWPGPHHHHPGSWSNNGWPHKGRPSWDHGRPNSWEDQGRPSEWYDQSGNNEWYNQQRPDPVPDSRKPVTWGPVTPPTTASPITNDRSPLAIATCIRSCPVTSEYNPVCGTNNVTYGNPGRLDCAKFCGVDVTLARNSPCPPAGATSDTTPQRNVTKPTQPAFPSEPNTDRPEPTRFTTVDVPVTNMPNKEPDPATIPADILNSIFTSTTTEETEYAFDIRTRSQFMPQYVYPIETK